MKPFSYSRHLASGAVSPAEAAEVRKFAAALIETLGTAGVAEAVAEGTLAEIFPFSAKLHDYDPRKARRRPVPAQLHKPLNAPADELIGQVNEASKCAVYEEMSEAQYSKFAKMIATAPIVEIIGAKTYVLGSRWIVLDINGEKALLELTSNRPLLASALSGTKARRRIIARDRR